MLDLLLLLSTGAFIAAGAVVGARLLLLAWRTRQGVDFVVGFSLFDLSAIAYPLILLGTFGGLPVESARYVFIGSATALALGWAGVFIFTLRVFRAGAGWALALTAAGLALLGYGYVESVRFALGAPDLAALRTPMNPVLWIEAAAIVVYVWTALEGFRCWEQARRRLALGLADPLVVNRFLLWGWIGAFALVSVAPSFAISLAGGDGATNVLARLGTGFGGLACAIAMQLAFMPPAAYRRWLTGNATA